MPSSARSLRYNASTASDGFASYICVFVCLKFSVVWSSSRPYASPPPLIADMRGVVGAPVARGLKFVGPCPFICVPWKLAL